MSNVNGTNPNITSRTLRVGHNESGLLRRLLTRLVDKTLDVLVIGLVRGRVVDYPADVSPNVTTIIVSLNQELIKVIALRLDSPFRRMRQRQGEMSPYYFIQSTKPVGDVLKELDATFMKVERYT